MAKVKRGKYRSHGLAVLTLFFGVHSTSADEIFGRWCDHMIPGTNSMNGVVIIKSDETGKVFAEVEYFDGSSSRKKLTEESGQMFYIDNGGSGDRYRIVSNSGELQILDNDGLIRTASRLEIQPKPKDCLP